MILIIIMLRFQKLIDSKWIKNATIAEFGNI